MSNYYEYLIYGLFIVCILLNHSASYWKGKYEGAVENGEDLADEIMWLHLNISPEKYKTFYEDN